MAWLQFTAAGDSLSKAVVALRKKAGLTQRQLATALGREQNFVARIEQGQRRLDVIELIAVCLACGADPKTEIAKIIADVIPLVPKRHRQRPG